MGKGPDLQSVALLLVLFVWLGSQSKSEFEEVKFEALPSFIQEEENAVVLFSE